MNLSNICYSPTWKLWRIGVGLLVGCLSTITSVAQSNPIIPDDNSPMRFVIVRSNAPGCEPTCPEWISAEGKIVSGSPGRLRTLLEHIGGRRLPVVLYSSGGDVDAALALGYLIREKKLDTMVARTVFVDCATREKKCNRGKDKFRVFAGVTQTEGALCSSACTVVLAGGTKRLANCYPCVGIHEIVMIRSNSKKK